MARMIWEPIYTGTIASGDSVTSVVYDIRFGSHFAVIVDQCSANADYDITYKCAVVETDSFIDPMNNVILDNVDGVTAVDFAPIPIQFIKIIIKNNSVNPVTLRARFVRQEGL